MTKSDLTKDADQLVEELGLSDLILSAAGVGISAIGFDAFSAKLSNLEGKIRMPRIESHVISSGAKLLRPDFVIEGLTQLRTIADQFEEAWLLKDPGTQWSIIAAQAHLLANQFERLFHEMLDHEPSRVSTLEVLADALALANSLRIKSRLAGGDDAVAMKAAEQGATALILMKERLSAGEDALEHIALSSTSSAKWRPIIGAEADALWESAEKLRVLQNAAISTINLIEELAAQEITGRVWLEAARAEHNVPLIYLPSR